MPGVSLDIDAYLQRLQTELDRVDRTEVDRLGQLIFDAWEQGRFVFILGNGGSATLASHLCEDLAKGAFLEDDLRADRKRRLKVLSLTDNVGFLTALGNDMGYDIVDARGEVLAEIRPRTLDSGRVERDERVGERAANLLANLIFGGIVKDPRIVEGASS